MDALTDSLRSVLEDREKVKTAARFIVPLMYGGECMGGHWTLVQYDDKRLHLPR